MNHSRLKIFMLALIIGTLLGGLALPARPAEAVWSNVPMDIVNRVMQVFTDEETHDAIAEAAKAWAMKRWQKIVMNLVSKNGGFVWNYGEYIYGSGNNAAAKYWRAFLQNCANINPTVSLSIQATGVEQKNYDWCPVRINVRGVNIQENIDLSNDFGWDDFSDLVANNSYRQYFQLADQVEEARQAAQNVKTVEATSSGLKPKTEEVCSADFVGPRTPEQQASCDQVKTPVQSFLNMINAATGGVVQVTANQKSIIASAITMTLLDYASDQLLNVYEKNGGNYGEYFR